MLIATAGFIVVSGALLLAREHPEGSEGAWKGAEKLWKRATLPWRLARLSALPPNDRYLMPVYGAKVSRVSDSWGSARGDVRTHEGQDIFAPRGTPVFAAVPGLVVKKGWNGLGGNYVLVAGTGGVRYYYAHLDEYSEGIEIGDEVSTTTVLGFVGTTGNAEGTPPHLHFGVYVAGSAVNPLPFLSDREFPQYAS